MIISIATQKGGVGKSSTAISLASGLVRHFGKKVLICDIDPQANTSKVLLPNYMDLKEEDSICAAIIPKNSAGQDDISLQKLPLTSTSIPNLDIIPAHIALADADYRLSTTSSEIRKSRLKNALEAVRSVYDFTIIDSPPSLGWLTMNALTASDKVLVPVGPGYFEIDSVVQFNKTVLEVQKDANPNIDILGYIFVMSDPTVSSRVSLQTLRQAFTDKVCKTVIPRNVDIRDASFAKKDIFDYSPKSAGAQAYLKLIKELFIEN